MMARLGEMPICKPDQERSMLKSTAVRFPETLPYWAPKYISTTSEPFAKSHFSFLFFVHERRFTTSVISDKKDHTSIYKQFNMLERGLLYYFP